ncbi:hypothetical protein E1091_02330 [Micromonospora fluostatini]|uniref:Uncharacterized protein n=1 Tax=Micromonospora fluostatini TaxID=1629071 RepID=A0ABY2DL08_9ACTN|nr:hypothetical protein E1091_02330 [Micromonospora fluostatini]
MDQNTTTSPAPEPTTPGPGDAPAPTVQERVDQALADIDTTIAQSAEQTLAGPTQTTESAGGETTVGNADDTELAVLERLIDELKGELNKTNDAVDHLAPLRENIRSIYQQLQDLTQGAAKPTQATRTAIEYAGQLIPIIGQMIGEASTQLGEAIELAKTAHEGLAPARQAVETLTAAGANTELIQETSA